jgi:signal transduction histidine kinase
MGLGLTLVREITSALQGTVDVDSEIGKGSTFTLSLPSLAEAAAEPTPAIQKNIEEHDR